MKKNILLYVLMGGASMLSLNLSAAELTQADKEARKCYMKALDKYDSGEYKEALKFLDQAETKLGETNPRISYLKARSQYALKNYTEAQKACKVYFSSPVIKDDGYTLMTKLNDEVNLLVDSINKKTRDDVAKQLNEAAEKEAAAKAAAADRATVMKQAAMRRAQDAVEQKRCKEQEYNVFQEVQKKNTKEAYQQFIYDYPSGYYVAQAKSEMNKKWPSLTRVLRNNKYGYVDKNNSMVIKAKYDYASDFSEGMARVAKAGKYGFVNELGKEIVPLNYQTASNFSYGWAVLKSNDNSAFFVNKTGQKMNEAVWYDAKAFSEGLAAVQNEFFKYGFIDVEGNEVIPCEYNTVSWFKEGLVAVSKKMENGKIAYGYINKSGNPITAFEFDDAKDFQDGVACVKKNGKFGLIDKFGGPITECEYDYISSFNGEGYALAKKNGWDVYLDREGVQWAKANGKYIKLN